MYKVNNGTIKDHSGDAFVGQYYTDRGWFPFTVIREFSFKDDELVYTGTRIVTLVGEKLGTIVFKLIAYKGIFHPEMDGEIYLDENIIHTITLAIQNHDHIENFDRVSEEIFPKP